MTLKIQLLLTITYPIMNAWFYAGFTPMVKTQLNYISITT
jgi:hypothetical protein